MGLRASKMLKLVVRKRLVDSAKAQARSWKIGPRARAPIAVYRDPVAEPARHGATQRLAAGKIRT